MSEVCPSTIAVVIPTLNAPDSLVDVLESIVSQSIPSVEIVVVSQKNHDRARQIVEQSGLPQARVIESPPGLSRARNEGLRALTSKWSVVALPDDDIRYRPDAFAEVFRSHPGWSAISGQVQPEDDSELSRLNFSEQQLQLNKRTVWTSAIEAAFFLSREFVEDVGYFDEGLGLGSHSIWQSGEGTDLLLRGLKRGLTVLYNPDIVLYEAVSPVSSKEHVAKVQKYARGAGRVYRRHYNFIQQVGLILRSVAKLVLAAARKGPTGARVPAVLLLGRVEGLLGVRIAGV
ncbi:glycosyltransferase [Vibrio cholerae]|nr:glycosyltransferase [Vibrio cholerae]